MSVRNKHHQFTIPAPSLSLTRVHAPLQVHTSVGVGSDLVGGEAALGRRARGVRERHVERDRLRDELFVCGDGGVARRRLLQGAEGERGTGSRFHRRAAARAVGHVGSDAHIRRPLLRR